MSEFFKVDIYDKLIVNGKAVKSGEGKTPTDVPAGSSTTINFESEVNSKGKLRTFSRSVKVNSTTVQVQSKQHHCCGAFSDSRSSLHDLCMIGSPQN